MFVILGHWSRTSYWQLRMAPLGSQAADPGNLDPENGTNGKRTANRDRL